MASAGRLMDALPTGLGHWSRRVRTIFRPIWFVALAAAVIGVAIGEYNTVTRVVNTAGAFARYGLVANDEPPVRLESPYDAAAWHAGVRRGQAILTINGAGVAGDASIYKVADKLAAIRGPASLVLAPPGGPSRAVTLAPIDPDVVTRWMLWRTVIVRGYDSVTAIIVLVAAILLFARRGDDPVAGLLSLSFLLLLASYAWSWWLEEAHWPWLVAIVRPTAWMLLNFVLFVFPDGRFQPRWTVLSLVILPIAWLGWVIGEPFGVTVIVNAIGLLLAVVAMRGRFRRIAAGPRQQIKFALLGFASGLVFLLAGSLCEFVVPSLSRDLYTVQWAEVLRELATITMVGSFALGLLVSLLRYRLYDAEAILSRSAAYAILTVMIGAVWTAGERGIEKIVELSFGHEAGVSATLLAAGFAAALVAPVHNRVHHWTEKRFQRALVHLRKGLPEFVDDMRETAEPIDLIEATLHRIESGVRAQHSAAVAPDHGGWRVIAARDIDAAAAEAWSSGWQPARTHALDCDRDDPLFPVRMRLLAEGRELGWILIGPRPDGSFYGKDEREALSEIAEPISRGISVAERREARWRKMHTAIDALAARLTRLEQAGSPMEKRA